MESSLFKDLLNVTYQYRRRFAIAFIMVLISNCLLVFNPLVFRQAVMALDPTSESPQGFLGHAFIWLFGSNISSLPLWTLLLVVIALGGAFFKYHMRIAFIAISRDVESQVRSHLFERIQNQSRKFFDHHPVGELMSRLTNDISAYRDVLGPGIMYPLYFLTLVVPAMLALFSISSSLALLSLVPVLVLPILVLIIEKYVYQTSLEVQKTLGEMSTAAHENFSGIRIVKSYAMEKEMGAHFRLLCQQFIGMNIRLACYDGMFFPFLIFLTRTVTVFLLLLAGFIILKAWSTLNAADFVSFMWIQSNIFGPVLMLGWVLPMYIRGKASYQRLLDIYQEPIEVKEEPHAKDEIPPHADIIFHHLNFTYPKATNETITDLNLEIRGNSFVGITGPVGAGKTTLFRLLMREYEIPKGMILIAGKDIHEYTLSAIRDSMVTVEQYPFLFSKTIAENVLFGRSSADQSELEWVSRHADLHETVIRFPEQYETLVGERGVTLSGGQKQRLAIARAFLVKRSILLMDDIFSAVDSETEKKIFSSMQKQFSGKTIIMITHRVSVLEQLDRVIYMSQGKIVEDGAPAELLEKKGYYAALVELQRIQDSAK